MLLLLRSKALQREAEDLRERIKHLNDMVFCQQRKVKGMIEEVRSAHIPCVVLCSSIATVIPASDQVCSVFELTETEHRNKVLELVG